MSYNKTDHSLVNFAIFSLFHDLFPKMGMFSQHDTHAK